MKKLFLFVLAIMLAATVLPVLAEGGDTFETTDDEEIEEWIDLDDEDEIVEWVDLDDEEVEIEEWVDLDGENPAALGPVVLCEITSDMAYERKDPGEDSKVLNRHYKGEILAFVDISSDWWLLKNGNYVSAEDVTVTNPADMPGAAEMELDIDPYAEYDMTVVLAGIAMSKEELIDKYHSLAIYDMFERKINCYKYGIESLEIDCSEASSISPVFPAWTITKDFTEEGTGAVGVDELMEYIYRYLVPGSYLVIFP